MPHKIFLILLTALASSVLAMERPEEAPPSCTITETTIETITETGDLELHLTGLPDELLLPIIKNLPLKDKWALAQTHSHLDFLCKQEFIWDQQWPYWKKRLYEIYKKEFESGSDTKVFIGYDKIIALLPPSNNTEEIKRILSNYFDVMPTPILVRLLARIFDTSVSKKVLHLTLSNLSRENTPSLSAPTFFSTVFYAGYLFRLGWEDSALEQLLKAITALKTPHIYKLAHIYKGSEDSIDPQVILRITELPLIERIAFIEKIYRLTKDIYKFPAENIVWRLVSLPSTERIEFMDKINPLIEGMEAHRILGLIEDLLNWPHARRIEFIDKLPTSLLKRIKCCWLRYRVIMFFEPIPPIYCMDFTKKVLSFFQKPLMVEDGYYGEKPSDYPKFRCLVKDLYTINPTDLFFYLHNPSPILKGTRYRIAKLIDTIKTIPENEQHSVFETSAPLMKGIHDGKVRAFIIKTFLPLPEKERSNFGATIKPVINGIKCEYEKMRVMTQLGSLSPEERENILKLTEPLFQGIYKVNYFTILKIFAVTPPSLYQEAIRAAQLFEKGELSGQTKHSVFLPRDFHSRILAYGPFLKQKMLKSWSDILTSSNKNTRIARYLVKRYKRLNLNKEHPLIQRAAQVIIDTAREAEQAPAQDLLIQKARDILTP